VKPKVPSGGVNAELPGGLVLPTGGTGGSVGKTGWPGVAPGIPVPTAGTVPSSVGGASGAPTTMGGTSAGAVTTGVPLPPRPTSTPATPAPSPPLPPAVAPAIATPPTGSIHHQPPNDEPSSVNTGGGKGEPTAPTSGTRAVGTAADATMPTSGAASSCVHG
jgi:hypothetical protein